MQNTGLTAIQISRMRNVFSQYGQIEKVLLYGSRAMGSYSPASDVDLAIVARAMNFTLQNKLEADLDDLLFPIWFDVQLHHSIRNDELLGHIDRVGIVIYEKVAVI